MYSELCYSKMLQSNDYKRHGSQPKQTLFQMTVPDREKGNLYIKMFYGTISLKIFVFYLHERVILINIHAST